MGSASSQPSPGAERANQGSDSGGRLYVSEGPHAGALPSAAASSRMSSVRVRECMSVTAWEGKAERVRTFIVNVWGLEHCNKSEESDAAKCKRWCPWCVDA